MSTKSKQFQVYNSNIASHLALMILNFRTVKPAVALLYSFFFGQRYLLYAVESQDWAAAF